MGGVVVRKRPNKFCTEFRRWRKQRGALTYPHAWEITEIRESEKQDKKFKKKHLKREINKMIIDKD
jgi:hypothetical protein